MTFNSIGDLAQGFALRQQTNVLRLQMESLTQELSTGLTSDVTRHLSGNFSILADVKHKLALLDVQAAAANQGRTDASAMQAALEKFQTETTLLSSTATSFAVSPGSNLTSGVANEARAALGSMLSSLNVSMGGRSLFAGDEVYKAALAQQNAFMSAIRVAASGVSSKADLDAAMDLFFDSPGGDFDTLIYQGGSGTRSSYALGEGESVTLDIRADDPVFRETLKQVSRAALLDDPAVSLTRAEQITLSREVGEALLWHQDKLTELRADLGFAESRIDRAATRISAETTGLNMIEADLLSADPFAAATELETVQLRLETLYTLTSRMSRLNLANFLS